MSLSATDYYLQCSKCGWKCEQLNHCLHCPQCGREALLVSQYRKPIAIEGDANCFSAYRAWLPYKNILNIDGPRMSTVHAGKFGEMIGIPNLWISISGYSPRFGSSFITGTFKECEAIGVLNRVSEETDRTLIVSSAGNAGRAFLELGARYEVPAIVVMPEQAAPRVTVRQLPDSAPLLILLKDSYYPDAIRFVDAIVDRYSSSLVREGGCYNVARRDSMAVPFLRAVQSMGSLPDRYIQAVGSGTGAIAACEAAKRLIDFSLFSQKTMRLLLVQNVPFTPMVNAWSSGTRYITPLSSQVIRERLSQTYAKVLSNANPPYAVVGGVYDSLKLSDGSMCSVTNDEIIFAQDLAANFFGFEPCDASAAALAGLMQSVNNGTIDRGEHVLLHFTGGGMKDIACDLGEHPYSKSITITPQTDEYLFNTIETYLENVM